MYITSSIFHFFAVSLIIFRKAFRPGVAFAPPSEVIFSEAEPEAPARGRSADVHVERKQTTVRPVVTATA